MSIDNVDARCENGQVEIGLFEGEESREVVSLSLEAALKLQDALTKAIVEKTKEQSRFCCPTCHSRNVQISFPTWYREMPDYTLITIAVDDEADIQWWSCEDCHEGETGSPMEVTERRDELRAHRDELLTMMPPQQLDSIDAEELAELERLFDAEPAHPGFNDVWTNSDQAAACAEGWAIFEAHGYLEIEKDDNPDSDEVPELQDDDAAIAHVEARAAAGSEMHQRALAVHRKYTESIRKAAFGEGEES